jgi:predicted Fe-S protein YdhL (DUF1289 family)
MTDTEIIARAPCLGDCNINEDGICLSCFLSSEENDRWNQSSNQERLAMLENTQLRQDAYLDGKPMNEIGKVTRD